MLTFNSTKFFNSADYNKPAVRKCHY